MNTGGGFVFKAIRREFCAGGSLPDHCFNFELSASGGGWLDAPGYFPAGSMRRLPPLLQGGEDEIFQRTASRE